MTDSDDFRIKKSTTFGKNLKELRKSCKLTQSQVSTYLELQGFNMPRYGYAKIEQGRYSISVHILVVLRKRFDCSFDDMFKNI